MSAFSLSLKQFARRVTKSASYENASSDPCFLVQALVLDGIPINGITLQDAKVVLSDVLRSEHCLERKDVNLFVSPVEGVHVLGRDGQELLKYGLPDIAFGGIDADHPEYLVIVGSRGQKAKCHLFYCGEASRTKMILMSLKKSFQRGKEIFGIEPEGTDKDEDVFKAQGYMNVFKQHNGYTKALDDTADHRTNHSNTESKTDSRGFFGRLAPRSYSDASALRSSKSRLRSRDPGSSYSKLEDV